MRTIYCRWPGCGVGVASLAGTIPVLCPRCGKPGRWSTDPPAVEGDEPRHAYTLTHGDRRLLRALRISPDEE